MAISILIQNKLTHSSYYIHLILNVVYICYVLHLSVSVLISIKRELAITLVLSNIIQL